MPTTLWLCPHVDISTLWHRTWMLHLECTIICILYNGSVAENKGNSHIAVCTTLYNRIYCWYICTSDTDSVSLGLAMAEDDYYVAGVAISLSVVHGGPAPRFLASELYTALVSSPDKVTVTVSALPETTWKQDLEAVSFTYPLHIRCLSVYFLMYFSDISQCIGSYIFFPLYLKPAVHISFFRSLFQVFLGRSLPLQHALLHLLGDAVITYCQHVSKPQTDFGSRVVTRLCTLCTSWSHNTAHDCESRLSLMHCNWQCMCSCQEPVMLVPCSH